MLKWLAGLLTLCGLLGTVPAGAQEIGGTVRDTTGAALPGVTVDVRSPALIEQVRSAVTNDTGHFLVVSLVPGTYSVTFTLTGFRSLNRGEIRLTTGFTATIDVQLEIGAVEQTVTVSGQTPVVDTQNVRQQAVMDRQVIDSVPTGRQFASLGILIPGMTNGGALASQDVGGQGGKNDAALVIHGGRPSDQLVQIDGMSAETFASPGTSAVFMSDGKFSEMAIDYSGNSAEVETGGVRVNLIPRDGGNKFSGGFFGDLALQRLQADNFDDDLRARGVQQPNRMKELWSVNPTFGGPIISNRLWFFAQHQRQRADSFVANAYKNADRTGRTYVPDTSHLIANDRLNHSTSVRLTAQLTKRQKLAVYFDYNRNETPHGLLGNLAGVTITPEASLSGLAKNRVLQATWTAPFTNRLLIDAGVSYVGQDSVSGPSPEAIASVPSVLQLSPNVLLNSFAAFLQGIDNNHIVIGTRSARASMAYVTGSHSVKTGFTVTWGCQHDRYINHAQDLTYITFRGSPIQVSYFALPREVFTCTAPNLGVYAQDQWRLQRLTLNAGARFDYLRSGYKDEVLPPTRWISTEQRVKGATAQAWKDIEPRLGVSYDLFGDGRTAVKASAGRYVVREANKLAEQLNPYGYNNPGMRLDRAWSDSNGNFFPDGDPLNPLPNGELIGQSTNLSFGTPKLTTFYDPAWAFAWRARPADWEFQASVQHQLIKGVALNGAYFRRVYVSFPYDLNRLVTPADYTAFSVTVPSDSRLPGSGSTLGNLYDLNPNMVGQLDKYRTKADNFGDRLEHWNGFDIGVNARLGKGLVQGGMSTGRTMTDTCNLRVPAPDAVLVTGAPSATAVDREPTTFCHVQTPWLTQFKGFAAYTLPLGIDVAATLQNAPGPERRAIVTFTNANVMPSLGRPLSGGAQTIQLNVLRPGTQYGSRLTQVDVRVAKTLKVRQGRLKAIFDLYNLFNGNTVLGENAAFGPSWLNATAILPPRLGKLGLQFSF